MDLQSKELYGNVLDELIAIKKDCDVQTETSENLKEAVENMPILVPVVGEFSAGKSSLLNKMIGKDILAVNMNAETAIPAELYYSETEYDEGVRADGKAERITDIASAPGKYVCVRRHINSQFLKSIQPLVPVDMPGFDSPLDAHDKAIYNYLERGIHYAVLVPADAGTISKSMQRQVQNILAFNKACTFFISKTDLRSEDEVAAVKAELQNELSMLTGSAVTLQGISQEDASLFGDFVNTLNPDSLFRQQFHEKILDDCYDTKSALNTRIAALKTDTDKNAKAIAELENSIAKIEEKKEKLIERAKNDSFSDEADSIASAVGSALNADLDSLVSVAKSGGSEALQEEINSIVRNTVVSNIQSVMGSVSMRFSKELSGEMKDLSSLLSQYNSGDVISKLQNSAQGMFDTAKASVDSYIQGRKGKEGASTAYKAITGILAAATDVVAPWLEIVIILLPEILNFIFGAVREKQQDAKIRQSIAGQIPSIKRQVRTKAAEILKANSGDTITAICAQFDAELQKKKADIENVQKSSNESAEKIAAQAEKYSRYVSQIDNLLEKLIA